jgi:hypothetical protein
LGGAAFAAAACLVSSDMSEPFLASCSLSFVFAFSALDAFDALAPESGAGAAAAAEEEEDEEAAAERAAVEEEEEEEEEAAAGAEAEAGAVGLAVACLANIPATVLVPAADEDLRTSLSAVAAHIQERIRNLEKRCKHKRR